MFKLLWSRQGILENKSTNFPNFETGGTEKGFCIVTMSIAGLFAIRRSSTSGHLKTFDKAKEIAIKQWVPHSHDCLLQNETIF